MFRFHIVSGDTPCIMEFTTYRYTDTPHCNIPAMYRPTPPPLVVHTLPRAPSDVSLASREPEAPSTVEEESNVAWPNTNVENEEHQNLKEQSTVQELKETKI